MMTQFIGCDLFWMAASTLHMVALMALMPGSRALMDVGEPLVIDVDSVVVTAAVAAAVAAAAAAPYSASR